MDENVDELAGMFGESSLSMTRNSIAREHPRFAQYKYTGKAEESQERRRREYLQRQKEARFDYANHVRKLAMVEFDDDELKDKNESRAHKLRRRYAGELMMSEWLVDIPESLSEEWRFVPCPVGRRCLVVASNGVTSAYNKAGFRIKQFCSYLPGGSRSNKKKFTILDCIMVKETVFYCLDLIAWSGISYAENDFICRRFVLESKITEDENLREQSQYNAHPFIYLTDCTCEKKNMEEMIRRKFEFEIDGILFYHQSVLYRSGQNPLIGWLKPWMLPEILSVSVPDELIARNAQFGTSRAFIEKFNAEHGHVSQIKIDELRSKNGDAEAVMVE